MCKNQYVLFKCLGLKENSFYGNYFLKMCKNQYVLFKCLGLKENREIQPPPLSPQTIDWQHPKYGAKAKLEKTAMFYITSLTSKG